MLLQKVEYLFSQLDSNADFPPTTQQTAVQQELKQRGDKATADFQQFVGKTWRHSTPCSASITSATSSQDALTQGLQPYPFARNSFRETSCAKLTGLAGGAPLTR